MIMGDYIHGIQLLNPRGVCPSGWHVSSNAEWEEMVAFLGGEGVAGAKLKEAGEAHWESW